jgi:hypothetical protein
MACKIVQDGDHNNSLVLTENGNTFLYQAYVGRVDLSANDSVIVFVDDHAVQTGTQSTLIGNAARTWYDGLSYAKVESAAVPVEVTSFTASVSRNNIELNWETKSETNNSGFEIERFNNKIWDKIGFVKGKGTSTEYAKYSFIDKNVYDHLLKYRLKQIDYDGSFEYSDVIEVNYIAPLNFSLEQNYPNPFNPTTTINYSLPKDGYVELKIYNSLGQEIIALVNRQMPAGNHDVTWNAQDFPSGIYFCKITFDAHSKMNKMILLK